MLGWSFVADGSALAASRVANPVPYQCMTTEATVAPLCGGTGWEG
jgi:hypothetical protein